jgi:hypothetical protein
MQLQVIFTFVGQMQMAPKSRSLPHIHSREAAHTHSRGLTPKLKGEMCHTSPLRQYRLFFIKPSY